MTREHVIVAAGGDVATMWYRCSCGAETGYLYLDDEDREPTALAPWRIGHASAVDGMTEKIDAVDLSTHGGVRFLRNQTTGPWTHGCGADPDIRWVVDGMTAKQREDLAVGCDRLLRLAWSDEHEFAIELLVRLGHLTRSSLDE